MGGIFFVFEFMILWGGGRFLLGIGELVIIRFVGLGLFEGRGFCGFVSIGLVFDNILLEDIVWNGVLFDIIGNGELCGILLEDFGGNVGFLENMGNGELWDILLVFIGGWLKFVEFFNDENMFCGCV